MVKKLEQEGAKIIFCPVFEVDYKKDKEVTRKLPHVRAYENVVYFVTCDAFTPKTLSESYVYHPLKALAKIKKKEGLIIADLDMNELVALRKYYDCWK